MIRYFLDTDTCIELIRKKTDRILERLKRCRIGTVGISTVTLGELQYGVSRSHDPARNRIALAEFCAPLELPSFDDRAAAVYGRIRAQLEKKGLSIGPLDTLIAAHALSLSATLVTHNLREFNRVEGLKVESWR